MTDCFIIAIHTTIPPPQLREAQRRGNVARAGSVEAWVRHFYQHRRLYGDGVLDVDAAARHATAAQHQHQQRASGPSLWALALTALVASLVVKALQSGALRLSI